MPSQAPDLSSKCRRPASALDPEVSGDHWSSDGSFSDFHLPRSLARFGIGIVTNWTSVIMYENTHTWNSTILTLMGYFKYDQKLDSCFKISPIQPFSNVLTQRIPFQSQGTSANIFYIYRSHTLMRWSVGSMLLTFVVR